MDTQVAGILSALALVIPTALAQDLENLKPVDEAGKSIADKSIVDVPSRTLIGDEKAEWIETMRKKLPIAQRNVGPFGLPQDPNAEVAKPQKKKMKKGAFLEAIAAIKVNAVMPSDDKFTIGSREFNEGDIFPLIRNQRQFNIKIISVKGGSILFKNVDTGEHVKRNLHSLPPGMKKNTSLVAIQGIFPANKRNATPLNLDDEPLPVSNE